MLLQRSALGLQRGVASRLCTYGGRVQPAIVRLNRLPSTDPPSGRAASSAAPSLRSVLVRAAAAAEPAARAASFAELGLSEGLQAGLTNNNITQPTEIQALSVPAILGGGDFLVASHTGSGKTLAYLLPMIEQLKQAEAEGDTRRPRRPRMLVLGPTKELVEQLTKVAKSLSHTAKFASTMLTSSGSKSDQRAALAAPLDVVFATPGRLLQHNEEGAVHLGDVKWVVVDEADTMILKGFEPEVRKIIGAVKGKAEPAQVVLVSATVPPEIQKLMAQLLPGMRPLRTASLHRAIAGSRHQFVSVPPGGNKLALAVQLVQGDAARGRRVLVFCGTVDSCRALDHYCQENGVPTVCYHGSMAPAQRKEAMAQFAGANPESPDANPVMVCTDLAARGLDFPARVDHVVNFDFPKSPIDYLHRTGRTARAGSSGKVTSIVGKHDKVLANRIEWALTHNEPIDQLTRNQDAVTAAPKPAAPSRGRQETSGRRARGGDDGDRRGGGPAGGRGRGRSSSRGPGAGGGRGRASSGGRGGFGGGESGGGARGGGSSRGGGGGGGSRGLSGYNYASVGGGRGGRGAGGGGRDGGGGGRGGGGRGGGRGGAGRGGRAGGGRR